MPSRSQTKAVLMKQGAGALTYILRDQFITADAAPLDASRAAEPGPGTLTKNADTGEYASINASGQFVWSGGPSNFSGDPSYNLGAFDRTAGRTLYFRVVVGGTLARQMIGWYRTASVTTNWAVAAHMLDMQTTVWSFRNANLSTVESNSAGIAINTTYDVAIVLHNSGAAYYIKGGEYTNWSLLWNELIDNTTPVYPVLANHSSTYAHDEIAVADLSGEWTNDFIHASVNVDNPTTGQGGTGTADGLHYMAFTLPGSPSAGQMIELRYRVQDANNYWTAYILRNAGNTAWDFRLDSVASGTPTNRVNVTGVSTPDAIQVRAEGDRHNCYTRESSTWTKRSNEVSVTHLNTQTAINTTFPAGSVSKLVSMPYQTAPYGAQLDRFLA